MSKADDARRDAVLLRMLKTPPKPQSEMKLGKSKRKRLLSRRTQKNKTAAT